MIALLIFYLILFLLMIRNFKIRNYRASIIQKIFEKNLEDIQRGTYNDYRWNLFESISYTKMFLEFWRPLHSFYPKEFLKDLEKK